MIHCFHPPYRPMYGIPYKKWRKMSGLEKTKAIKEFRDQCNAQALALKLSGEFDDECVPVPFAYEPFEPYEARETIMEDEDGFW